MKKKLKITFSTLLIIISFIGCNEGKSEVKQEMKNIMNDKNPKLESATFGSGCFWCTDAIFERVNGVVTVVSGYSGGTVDDPAYKEVCEGLQDTLNVHKLLSILPLLALMSYWKYSGRRTIQQL